MNELLDKSDYECKLIFEIPQEDYEILDYLKTSRSSLGENHQDLKDLMDEYIKNCEEKIKLVIEIEYEKKLKEYKTRSMGRIEENLKFLLLEGNKYDLPTKARMENKIENYLKKADEALSLLD